VIYLSYTCAIICTLSVWIIIVHISIIKKYNYKEIFPKTNAFLFNKNELK